MRGLRENLWCARKPGVLAAATWRRGELYLQPSFVDVGGLTRLPDDESLARHHRREAIHGFAMW